MKRFYFAAGILFMAILLASCAAVTQPAQPTDTAQPAVSSPTAQQTQPATWKAYVHPQYGFTMNYPSDWQMNEYHYGDAVEQSTYVAFDPVHAMTQAEADAPGLGDVPLGMVTIVSEDQREYDANAAVATQEVQLGPDKIPAKYLAFSNISSPTAKTTGFEYHLVLPVKYQTTTAKALHITVVYAVKDTATTGPIIQQMLDSLQFQTDVSTSSVSPQTQSDLSPALKPSAGESVTGNASSTTLVAPLTSSVQTYNNPATGLGITFQYPAGWYHQDISEGCGPIFQPTKEADHSITNYWITVCWDNHVSDPDAAAERMRGFSSTPSTPKAITVAGNHAVQQEENDSGKYSINTYVTLTTTHGVMDYVITAYAQNKATLNTYSAAYNQVLGSIKPL